jgi:hypothetical protein
MATEVDICNLALGYLGDKATVASINPPEGSAQAAHCSRFYPICRDSLLESHPWSFATRRRTLALLGDGFPEWDFMYMQPSDAINLIAVLPPDSTDDYSENFRNLPAGVGSTYQPQDFSTEVLEDGTNVILTDQEDATLRYTVAQFDTAKFSPLFVEALAWKLASVLAGPLIKGEAGAMEAKRCMVFFKEVYSSAIESDSSQRRVNPTHNVKWIGRR